METCFVKLILRVCDKVIDYDVTGTMLPLTITPTTNEFRISIILSAQKIEIYKLQSKRETGHSRRMPGSSGIF